MGADIKSLAKEGALNAIRRRSEEPGAKNPIYYGPDDTVSGIRTARDSREIDGQRFQAEPEPRGLWKFVILMTVAAVLLFVGLNLLGNNQAYAQSPQLYDRQTGKYLGNLNSNRWDPNSVNNPWGQYGSRYSPDSINNPYGRYGSRYSNDSANNPWATNAPAVYGPGDSRNDW